MRELRTLLETRLNYECRVEVLNNDKKPQNQLNSAIASFVAEHDGHPRSHLLIVYYTGHGFLRPVKGADTHELVIAG